ncbi:hypothetical protein EBZ39_04005 [bacterium]|nr:hypothetical protein [bacterium]
MAKKKTKSNRSLRLPSPPKRGEPKNFGKKFYDPQFEEFRQLVDSDNYKTKSKTMYKDITRFLELTSERYSLEREQNRIEQRLRNVDKKIEAFYERMLDKY